MFTGLVQHKGTLTDRTLLGAEAELTVAAPFEQVEIGESIAVTGACLSVIRFEKGRFTAFASMETLEKTGIMNLAKGSPVNVERALRIGDPIGGHLVTGHVDDRIRLDSITPLGQASRLTFSLPGGSLAAQVAPKGSVAIDGVSLTVNAVRGTTFDVMVIPLTLKETTLGALRPGDTVNIETDVLAKYVARSISGSNGETTGIDADLLRRTGFVR